ncbi:MAG: transporter [Candidatus Cloacimonadota bacterium]|nr:MAG: transporter [Candidatus Cloacimonadota bacterium]
MMSLDLSKDIEVGKKVSLNIKPTFVAIGKNFSGELSYSNKINSIIDSIEYGELLCSIKLSSAESIFESIITVESASRMNLKVGDEVIALIKASELSISEILQ